MAVLLGGRAAEVVVFGQLSTGASDDHAKVTDIARSMVTRFGMVEKLGQVTFEEAPQSFLGTPPPSYGQERKYSEETAREIDTAVRDIVEQAFDKAVGILRSKRAILDFVGRVTREGGPDFGPPRFPDGYWTVDCRRPPVEVYESRLPHPARGGPPPA